jgi:predicted RNase H-like HicB family nuclease
MKFPVAIHKDEDSVFGVSVPDLRGCHSAGDTLEDALKNAKHAIELHVKRLVETGQKQSVSASHVEHLREQDIFADAVWAFVEVDVSALQA